MLENNLQPKINLEQEIALLNEQIEQKRGQLEQVNKIVDEKEIIKDTIVNNPTVLTDQTSQSDDRDDNSYLNDLDDQTADSVNGLVDRVFKQGLVKTLKSAKNLPALELDAFHDTLTDRLYTELQTRGFIK